MTAHFLRSTLVGAFEVHIQTLKTGKGLTNIIAELAQEGITKVTTHAIFGVNGPSPSDPIQLSLPPTSRYARHIPIYSHPSNPPPAKPLRDTWKFKGHVQLVEDTETLLKNEPDSPTRTSRSTIGGGGLEWAAWFEFKDEEDNITSRHEKPGLKISWFPTVTMSIEFKAPIPPLSPRHANRTVGLYSTGRFMGNPQAKHDAYVEVWTAPCNLGEGMPVEGWRDEQVCLAIATQMALMVPMEVNAKQGKGASKL
ncbi:thioesterase-like superfamily-domain-containing protein [Cyathus striatus]|nr:thioesterase-like superfamily-domain-containing protein [Cyathus striatus]